MDIDALAREAVDCGLAIHRNLGPGLLESVYEMVLARALEKRGIRVERQRLISFEYDGMKFEDAFRADLLAEGKLLIEVKAVEKPSPVHAKQVLTYLCRMRLPVGLLMNFGLATFKDGVQRIANNHIDRPLIGSNP
jgi:iron complex transport system substrate-binding protein